MATIFLLVLLLGDSVYIYALASTQLVLIMLLSLRYAPMHLFAACFVTTFGFFALKEGLFLPVNQIPDYSLFIAKTAEIFSYVVITATAVFNYLFRQPLPSSVVEQLKSLASKIKNRDQKAS